VGERCPLGTKTGKTDLGRATLQPPDYPQTLRMHAHPVNPPESATVNTPNTLTTLNATPTNFRSQNRPTPSPETSRNCSAWSGAPRRSPSPARSSPSSPRGSPRTRRPGRAVRSVRGERGRSSWTRTCFGWPRRAPTGGVLGCLLEFQGSLLGSRMDGLKSGSTPFFAQHCQPPKETLPRTGIHTVWHPQHHALSTR
jgi:hypothetical protein